MLQNVLAIASKGIDECSIKESSNTLEVLRWLQGLQARKAGEGNRCLDLNGELRIEGMEFHLEVLKPLRSIKSINGSLKITNNTLSFLIFDELMQIVGKSDYSLYIAENKRLLDIDFPVLSKVEGKIFVKDNPVLWSSWFIDGKSRVEEHVRSTDTFESKRRYPSCCTPLRGCSMLLLSLRIMSKQSSFKKVSQLM